MKTSDLTLPRVAAPAVLFLALAACDGAKDPQPVAQTPTTEAATDTQAKTASSTPAAAEATGLTTATSNSTKARTAASTGASTVASTGVSGEGKVTKTKPRSKGSDLTTAAEARQLTVKAPSRPGADSKMDVVFEPETLDLGRMQPGVPKTGIVRLTNNGNAAVQIKKAVASCGCTTPSWPREPILAGETAEIEITLKPSLKQGQRLSKRVTLQMMAGPPQVITVEGEVGVFVKIAPDFLDAAKQESADQQVLVLESLDETPFSIIAVEPEVLSGIGGEKMLRHDMAVDWALWEEAGRRPQVKLTTDHPNAPELSITVRRAITRDKPLPPARTVSTMASNKLIVATQAGDAAAVSKAIAAGEKLDASSLGGMTALHWAAKNGSMEIIDILLENEADPNAGNKVGKTPVAIAAESGHMTVLERLVAEGGKIDTTDEIGGTPLLWACALSKKPETVAFLIERGADVNVIDSNGMTPLIWAAGIGQPGAVELLVGQGADLETVEIHQQETAVMRAARIGNIENLRILVDAKADLEKTNLLGQSAVIIACSAAPVEKIQLLVDAGVNLESRDARGWSVLDHARARTDSNRGAVIEFLEATVPAKVKDATPAVGG
jgi:ankyrin repeat protein